MVRIFKMYRFSFKCFLLIAVLYLPTIAQVNGRSNKNDKTEKEVIEIVRQLAKATVQLDISAYERIWAEDIIATNVSGATFTKADDLEQLKSGKLKIETFEVDEIRVNVYGNTVVVTSRQTVKGQYGKTKIDQLNRVTDVFIKRNGMWQLIAEHTSSIPNK